MTWVNGNSLIWHDQLWCDQCTCISRYFEYPLHHRSRSCSGKSEMQFSSKFYWFFFSELFFFKLQYEIKQWLFICEGNHCHSFIFPIVRQVNYILSDDDTRWFRGQCRSRSECIECAVWSLIYNVHIFILDYNLIISLSCIGNVFLANEIDWLIDRLIEWCFTPFSIVF